MKPVHQELLNTLYQALLDREYLVEFMKLAGQAINSQTSYIETFTATPDGVKSTHCPIQYCSAEIAPQLEEYFSEGVQSNPYFPKLATHVRSGLVLFANDVIAHDQIVNTDHYNQWLAPLECNNISGICLDASDKGITLASFHHADTMLTDEQRATIEMLAPHMVRFFKLQALLGEAAEKTKILTEVLDKYSQGVVLLNFRGEAIYANHSAERIFTKGDGITLLHNKINVKPLQAHEKLSSILGGMLLNDGRGNDSFSHDSVIVERASSLRPYLLQTAPIGSNTIHITQSTPLIAVFIIDPEMELGLSYEQLMELYDLTPTEAKLALLICRGMTLDECAAHLDHQISTSRNLLKRVFLKTSTSKQHELVALLHKHALPTSF